MEAELRGQCDKLIDRLLHAFDYMDPVDSDYARQVAREIASGLSDTIAAQAAELEGLRKDAARWRFVSDGTSRGAVDFCVTRCDWRLPREDMHTILSGAGADTANRQHRTRGQRRRGG